MLVYYLWSVVFEQVFFGRVPPLPYICGHFRCEWCHHRLLHCGGCRMKPNKISFSPSCFFCSARPHLLTVLCFLGPAWFCSASSSSFLFSLLSLASRFLPEYACFSFILVSRHRRSACSCCGFAYVLHMNEFMRSLLTNFYCDSGLLHLFPCNFFY